MIARPALFLIVLISISFYSFAQNIGQKDWYHADTSIAGESNLQDLRRQIILWKEYYSLAKNDAMLARCFYYLQKIDDLTTEDTLFFKNSFYIDSILRSEGSSLLLKTIMQTLKAKRIATFAIDARFAMRRQLVSSYNSDARYENMGMNELDSMVILHFQKALDLGKSLPPMDTKELLWLSSDTTVFLFAPDLQDIIYAERIAAFEPKLYGTPYTKLTGLLRLSQDDFINLPVLTKAEEPANLLFQFYKEWIQRHRGKPEIYYYLETVARLDILRQAPNNEELTGLYEQYLRPLANSPFDMVRANAVYNLCEQWNWQAAKYNPVTSFSDDVSGEKTFTPAFRWYYADVLNLYELHQGLFRQFPRLDSLLADMKKDILRPNLLLDTYNAQVPGSPILALLRFRNTEKLFIKIQKQGTETAVQEKIQPLPKTKDFQWHNTFLKTEPLPAGRYVIRFSDSVICEENKNVGEVEIVVTQIAVVNTDRHVFVLDRKTGVPLTGATVTAARLVTKDEVEDTTWSALPPKIVNDSGYVVVDPDKTSLVKVKYRDDSCESLVNEHDSQLEDELYDKEYYDNLAEFFEEKAEVEVFTDRKLYRPGQVVHFKAIVFTRHPSTLEKIVWSGKKLRSPLFKKLFRSGSPKIRLYLYDPFNKKLDSITAVPDQYGAIAGTFMLPQAAGTGTWSIMAGAMDHGQNDGQFEVEEYKRPTFEILIEKPEKNIFIGDPIEVKMVVQSLSGARLNNTRINYFVQRYGYLPPPHEDDDYGPWKIISGTGYTDNNGEMVLRVQDTAVQGHEVPDTAEYYALYEVEAEAIDVTGETDKGRVSISQSNLPIRIHAEVPDMMERHALPPVKIVAWTDIEEKLKKPLQVRIYKQEPPSTKKDFPGWAAVDTFLYPQAVFEQWFPNMRPLPKADTSRTLVYDTLFTTGGENFILPREALPAGNYLMLLECREKGRLLQRWERSFAIFDKQTGTLPPPHKRMEYFPYGSVKVGEKLTWASGNLENNIYSIYHIGWFAKTKKGLQERSDYVMRQEKKGINEWEYIVPREATGKLSITHLYIADNKLYKDQRELMIEAPNAEPEIIVERFRSRMAPGGKETFTVSIKTKNERTLAQLMTTLYDASLDKIRQHNWYLPREYFPIRLDFEWPYEIAQKINAEIDFLPYDGFKLGWLRWLNEPFPFKRERLKGRVSGLSYYSLTTSNSVTRQGELMTVAVAGYSSLKRKNPVPAPEPGVEKLPAPSIRKNFSETAFFYPRILAGKDGYYTISFTLPQSVTTWMWKMLAHTQDAQFAYAERTLVSQLPLMVQPDMPRFLYQGDKILLKSRISNLDSLDMNGTLQCSIEDVVTGEDITARLLVNNKKSFSVQHSSNSTGIFEIVVPKDLMHPLRISIAAQSGLVSDGEEHVIPIRTKKILVSQRVASSDQPGATVKADLPADAEPYGVGMYVDPQPKGNIVNALPWLVSYPHACAEQTFNKIFAYALSLKIFRTDTSLKISTLHNRRPAQQTMPGILPEISMPWLNLVNRHALHQQQLQKLSDTNATRNNIEKLFDALVNLQNQDGSLSWFDGGAADFYISSYVLGGFGRLHLLLGDLYEDILDNYAFLVPALIRYCDEQFLRRDFSYNVTDLLQYLYGRSYFARSNPLPVPVRNRIDSMLTDRWQSIRLMSLGRQAMLTTVTLRLLPAENDLHKKARQHLESLRQLAIRDKNNGIRWKEIADADDLNISAEEWIVKIAEAFEGDANDHETIPGIIQWLLSAKQDHNWSGTKATADVISLLYRHPNDIPGRLQQWSLKYNNKSYTVSNDLLKGELYRFIEVNEKTFPDNLPAPTNSSFGLNLYYFAENPPIDSSGKSIKLRRSLYRYNSGSSEWEIISPATLLNPGDKIKATLAISTPRMLQYVYIDEKRAAACEPSDPLSHYEYGTEFSYYKSVRDMGYHFFAEKIPAGNSSISYEMVVAKTGSFAWGPAVLECMYRPEIKTYSNSQSVEVKE